MSCCNCPKPERVNVYHCGQHVMVDWFSDNSGLSPLLIIPLVCKVEMIFGKKIEFEIIRRLF